MITVIAQDCGETPIGDIAVASIFIAILILSGFLAWLGTRR